VANSTRGNAVFARSAGRDATEGTVTVCRLHRSRWQGLCIAWATLLVLSAVHAASPAGVWLLRALDELGRPRPSPGQVMVLGAIVASVADRDVDSAVNLIPRALPEADADAVLLDACKAIGPSGAANGVALAERISDRVRRDEALLTLANGARTAQPRIAAAAIQALTEGTAPDLLVEDVAATLAAEDAAQAIALAVTIVNERSRGSAFRRIAKAADSEQVAAALENACSGLRDPAGLCAARLGLGELQARLGDRQGSRANLDEAAKLLSKVRSDADRRRLREGIAAALGPDGVALLEPEIGRARGVRRAADRAAALTELVGPVGAADPARGEELAIEALGVAVTLPDNAQSLAAGLEAGRALLPFAPERARMIIDQAARAGLPGGSRPIEPPQDRARVIATAGAALLPVDADRAFAMLSVAIDTLSAAGKPGSLPPATLDAFTDQDAARTEALARRLPEPAAALCRIAEHVAAVDPATALRLARDALAAAGGGAVHDGIAARLAPRLAAHAPAEALALADALPEALRPPVLASVIEGLPVGVAAQQLGRAEAITDPELRLAALCRVAFAMAAADPDRALSVPALASAGMADSLRTEVLTELGRCEPGVAVERCQTLQSPDGRDRVVAAAARTLATSDPARALAVAGTLSDASLRARVLVELAEGEVPGAVDAARAATETVGDPAERLPLQARLAPCLPASDAETLVGQVADDARRLGAERFTSAQWTDIAAALAPTWPEQALPLARSAPLPDTRSRSLLAVGLALWGRPGDSSPLIVAEALVAARDIADPRARSDRFRWAGTLLAPVLPERAQEAFQAALEAAFDVPGTRARSDVALAMAQLDVSTGASWAYAVAQEDPLDAIDTLIAIGRSAAEREPIRAAMALSQAAQLTDALAAAEGIDPDIAEQKRAEQLVRIACDLAAMPDGADAARGLLEEAKAALSHQGAADAVAPELARDLAITGIRLQARVDLAKAQSLAQALPVAEDRAAAYLALAEDQVAPQEMLAAALDEADAVEDVPRRVAVLKEIARAWATTDPAQVPRVVERASPGEDRASVALAAARALRERPPAGGKDR